jgi:small subunit ribosomal protein S6
MTGLYELLYIIPATITDTEVGTVEAKISALLTKLGATIEFTKRLGKLKFTYVIKKQRYGHYIAVVLSADTLAIAKIDENLRINNDILRYLLLRTEKSVEQQKFDLIQFNEVNVEEERARRRERADEANAEKEKEKAAEGASENKEAAVEGASSEADKKSDATLTEETKTV